MNRAASRTSSRIPSASRSIQKLPRFVDGLDEKAIAHRTSHDQVDWTTQNLLQALLELEVPRQPKAEFVFRRVLNAEVDVAVRGVEVRRTDGAEDFEPGHAKLPAKGADGVHMIGNWAIFEAGVFWHRDLPLLVDGKTTTTLYQASVPQC